MDSKSRRVAATLEQALVEERGTDDVTTAITVEPGLRAAGTVVARQDCVLSGLGSSPASWRVIRLDQKSTSRFEVVDHPEMFDGVRVKKGQAVAVIRSNALAILACEQVVLNLMQRMSGISTCTRECVDVVAGAGPSTGRAQDRARSQAAGQYAVHCGEGGAIASISPTILVKGDHIGLAGEIPKVLARALLPARRGRPYPVKSGIAQSWSGADCGCGVAAAGQHEPHRAEAGGAMVRASGHAIPLEASGAIALENIREYTLAEVNFISWVR